MALFVLLVIFWMIFDGNFGQITRLFWINHQCSGGDSHGQSPALLEELIHELRIPLILFQRQKTNENEYNVHLGVKL